MNHAEQLCGDYDRFSSGEPLNCSFFMIHGSLVQKSPVHGDDLPGDVGVFRDGEDHPGDLLGPAEPTERDLPGK